MQTPQKNNPDAFKDLRLEQLQRYAERWVKKFSQVPIEKVLLYHTSNDYFRDASVKYTIVFEFNEEPRSELNRINQDFTNLIWPLMSKRYKLKTAISSKYKGLPRGWGCYRFQFNSIMASIKTKELHLFFWNHDRTGTFDPTEHVERIQKLRIVGDLKLSELKLAPPLFFRGRGTPFDDFLTAINHEKWTFIDAGFDVVYNSKPGTLKDCLSEWAFKIKTPETGIGKSIKTNEPFWVLYPAEQDSDFTYKETSSEEPKQSSLKACTQKWSENYFICEGDYWKVGFAGETLTIKDSKGLRTVVALLKNPNHEFYPLDLRQVVEGFNENLSDGEKETRDNYTQLSQKRNDDGESQLQSGEHLSLKAMPIERLFEDEEERKRFEKLINEVWERTTGNDSTEWKNLKEYLLNEKGVRLRYTYRGPVYKYLGRLDDDSEKARKTISNNIDNFKEKIKVKMPSLKNHLDIHIKTGNNFFYIADPTDPISWQIKDRWDFQEA